MEGGCSGGVYKLKLGRRKGLCVSCNKGTALMLSPPPLKSGNYPFKPGIEPHSFICF